MAEMIKPVVEKVEVATNFEELCKEKDSELTSVKKQLTDAKKTISNLVSQNKQLSDVARTALNCIDIVNANLKSTGTVLDMITGGNKNE